MVHAARTRARWGAAVMAIAPAVMLAGFLYHPHIGNPTDADFRANLGAAVEADPVRWAVAHLAITVGSGLIMLAFLALRAWLRAAGEERWSAPAVPFVVMGGAFYALLPAMEFAPLAAAGSGADAAAAHGALLPWFAPVLFTSAIIFLIGVNGSESVDDARADRERFALAGSYSPRRGLDRRGEAAIVRHAVGSSAQRTSSVGQVVTWSTRSVSRSLLPQRHDGPRSSRRSPRSSVLPAIHRLTRVPSLTLRWHSSAPVHGERPASGRHTTFHVPCMRVASGGFAAHGALNLPSTTPAAAAVEDWRLIARPTRHCPRARPPNG